MQRRLDQLGSTLLLMLALSVPASGAVQESFETPSVSWRVGWYDCAPLRLDTHERRFTEAHSGRGCEYLLLSAGMGTAIHLVHDITPAPIIAELRPSLWVKADRPGIQLMARVVFPRSMGKDGKPLTSFLLGDSYHDPGSWRQLRIDDLQRKLQREVWALRSRPEIAVDEREAYLDLLVLNAYTGAGRTSLAIDDLEMTALVEAGVPSPSANAGPVLAHEPDSSAARPQAMKPAPLLQGDMLLVEGRPFFARVVEHNGENFAFLQALGFNTIQLKAPATPAQVAEAERSDVWLIAPPPAVDPQVGLQAPGRQLAWYPGERLDKLGRDRAHEVIRDLKQADGVHRLPLLLHVSRGWRQFRQDNTIMLIERPVVGTSFEMTDYGDWLSHSAGRARASGPFWAAIPTEYPEELEQQWSLLVPAGERLAQVEPDQIRWLAFDAIAHGARGLWFRSRTRLDGTLPAAKRRAAAVHAVNCELELIAPWAAAGAVGSERLTDSPHVRLQLLKTETARLVIALRSASDQQFVTASGSSQTAAFVVPGAPLSDSAYGVALQGITNIPAPRGGGIRVTLDAAQPVSLVLLTQDPLAVNYVGRVSADFRRPYAARQLELMDTMLSQTAELDGQLSTQRRADSARATWLAQAQADARQATQLYDRGDLRGCLQFCSRALDACRQIRRRHWESAVLTFPSPVSSPLCVSFESLLQHQQLAQRLASLPPGVNVLAAGDMEQLEHLLQSGWRQQRADIRGLGMDAQLSLSDARSGRSSLHLRVWRENEQEGILDGEWPITISSAPFAVREGQVVRIHGWVKVPQPLVDSWDGLMIFDSQHGPALAERVLESRGWREFTLYRAARTSGEMQIIFAHTGLGDSWIDAVDVQILADPNSQPPSEQAHMPLMRLPR